MVDKLPYVHLLTTTAYYDAIMDGLLRQAAIYSQWLYDRPGPGQFAQFIRFVLRNDI